MIIYSLFETVSVPGSSHRNLLRSFKSKENAEKWLKENGYRYINHMKSYEKPGKDEYMVWTYVRIEESILEE